MGLLKIMRFPDPRIEYKASSKVLFRHGNLLDELRDIRRHHTSPVNQAIHILSIFIFFAFAFSTLVLISTLLQFPLSITLFLVILSFPVPYLGFFWYLDPVIAIFWAPIFLVALVGSLPIAAVLDDWVPLAAAIPLSVALGLLALLPQLVGHLLLEGNRVLAPHFFELLVMTPFFLGYCGVGWISCWVIRKGMTDKLWHEEASPDPKDAVGGKDVVEGKDLEG